MLKHRADVNAIYKDGRSALHAAIVKESKCFECAKLLLNAGVCVNKPDAYGYTPLHIAALNEFSSCAYMLIGTRVWTLFIGASTSDKLFMARL